MLEALRIELAARIAATLEAVGIVGAQVTVDVPPNRSLGDLAWAGALPLAKVLRRSPRAIAEEVASRIDLGSTPTSSALRLLEPLARVEGAGFLNFRLQRGPFLSHVLGVRGSRSRTPQPGRPAAAAKVIIEHTNINPNKAAHIGHLRNAVLGDTLTRCLRWLGHVVEVQNYVDDTGVQVADIVVGFLFLPEEELTAAVLPLWPEAANGEAGARSRVLRAFLERSEVGSLVLSELGAEDFDDLCWRLYPQVTARYEGEPEFLAHRPVVLHAIEGGFPPDLSLAEAIALLAASDPGTPTADPCAIARFAAAVAEANLHCHLLTMGRLGVGYDLLPHESDILHRGFWERAFELLMTAGVVHLEEQGKNAGCWVMSLAESPDFAGMSDADKILVRSNGTVTYTGKDIAYQLWKLGLLRDDDGTLHDFGYREFARFTQAAPAAPLAYSDDGTPLYRTSSEPAERPAGARFGGAEQVYNVIDVRQSYPQKVVREAVRTLGHVEAADNSIHFAYEMVALTPRAVRRLEETQGLSFGLTPEDMAKPFLEMSGRRGIGVKADALLATLVGEARRAIEARQANEPAIQGATVEARARDIAVGALRYQMARQGRNRVLAFDFEDALAFEGDTGPYLQYSAVRTAKIFDKLAGAGLAGTPDDDARSVVDADLPDDLWELVFACARTEEMVAKAVASLEFSLIAGHARELAQAFHRLYHEHPVLHAEDERLRTLRRAVFRLYLTTVTEILETLLGIPVPAEM